MLAATAAIVSWYMFVVAFSAVWGIVFVPLPLLLLFVILMGWMPFIQYAVEVLLGGMSLPDRAKVMTSLDLAKGILFVRAFLIVVQGLMLTVMYDYSTAREYTYRSYFVMGDALERLYVVLTLDLPNFFDFNVNIAPKILSIVVVVIELLMVLGTSTPNRVYELCGRRMVHFARWMNKQRKNVISALTVISCFKEQEFEPDEVHAR